MKLKFIHCSDLHLGRQRLGGKLPESDLSDALRYIVDYTIKCQANGLLIAGDLFDSPTIQPPHLQMVTDCLQPLKDSHTPVFAIEGNHDRSTFSSDTPTWVRYLNNQGYLHLLSIPFSADGPQITEWDPESRQGSLIHYQGIRIIGAGYLGAGTVRRMKAIREAFQTMDAGQAHQPTILLLHAGPEYLVHEGGGFDQESLEFLKGFVDYLALGHIHKPLNLRNWAVNPGTAENIRIEESAYDFRAGQAVPRGMAEIILDFDPSDVKLEVAILPVPHRPVQTIRFDCSPLTGRNIAQKIRENLLREVRTLGTTPETVIRVDLTGDLNLARAGLDPNELAEFLEKEVPVIATEIIWTDLNQPVSETVEDAGDGTQSRETIEKLAVRHLLHQSPIPELGDEQLTELADLFLSFKDDVRNTIHPEDILDKLNRHPAVSCLARAYTGKRTAEAVDLNEVAAGSAGGEHDDH